MDPNDLLKMLDLGGKEAPPPSEPLALGSERLEIPRSVPPTALEVDAWGLRRGRELLDESERLQESGTDAFGAADFFTAAFDPDPRLLESCADSHRREFIAQLLETPDYRELHAATRLDDTAASLAAGHFAEQFAKLKEDEGAHPADAIEQEMATLRAVGKALAAAKEEVGELGCATGSRQPRTFSIRN